MQTISGIRRSRSVQRLALAALVLTLGVAVLAGAHNVAEAQDEGVGLRLRLRRDFGYGGGAQIQGYFSILVDGVDNLERVVFYVDEQLMGEDGESPFRLRFNTGNYDVGWHTLRAVGYTSDGRELTSNAVQRQFVSGSTSTYVILGVVALVLGFRVISHVVTRDKSQTQKRGYGIYGGAVCPRCGRPFSRHWWAPNLIVGKFDRCPHCGKWHFATRATPQMLASAEQFADELEGEGANGLSERDEEENLRRRLDESRYEE